MCSAIFQDNFRFADFFQTMSIFFGLIEFDYEFYFLFNFVIVFE